MCTILGASSPRWRRSRLRLGDRSQATRTEDVANARQPAETIITKKRHQTSLAVAVITKVTVDRERVAGKTAALLPSILKLVLMRRLRGIFRVRYEWNVLVGSDESYSNKHKFNSDFPNAQTHVGTILICVKARLSTMVTNFILPDLTIWQIFLCRIFKSDQIYLNRCLLC